MTLTLLLLRIVWETLQWAWSVYFLVMLTLALFRRRVLEVHLRDWPALRFGGRDE